MPEAAIAAAQPDEGEGFVARSLDGIGGFFQRLFGGRAEARPQTYDNRSGRQSYDDRDHLRRDDTYGRDRYAANAGAGAGEPPDSNYASPYGYRPDPRSYDRYGPSEEDYRRAMERYRRDYGFYRR